MHRDAVEQDPVKNADAWSKLPWGKAARVKSVSRRDGA